MSLTVAIDQFPEQWRAVAMPFAPISALTSVTGLAQPGEVGYLGPGWAGLVLLGWAAILLGLAGSLVAHRDV
jgi:hypothetical protein